jgi:hypothetical protein
MLKIYLKCNNYNKLYVIDWHAHKFRVKSGVFWGPAPENFYIFEAVGLTLWRFLKQIRKQIAYKLTVFYKNGYHFTKIITLLCKFYLKMSKF